MKEEELTINGLASKVDGLADTVDTLARKVEQGFGVLDTMIDTKINDLVASVGRGFEAAKKDNDDLATSMGNYSNHIEKRFDKIDKRFDQIDKKIEDEIRSVKAEISLGLREIKEDIERLDTRIDRLFKQTTGDVSVLIEEQEKIKLRLKKLELKNSQV